MKFRSFTSVVLSRLPHPLHYFCDIARWLFCGYYDEGLCRRKLVNPSISYIHPSLSKQFYIKCERSRRDATESFFPPKINTKMPTRIKNVERYTRSWLIQKFICTTSSMNPEALNWKKQPPEVFYKKGASLCETTYYLWSIKDNVWMLSSSSYYASVMKWNVNPVTLISETKACSLRPAILFWRKTST